MILEPCTSSGSLTVGTTTVTSTASLLCSVVLNPGTAASSLTIYDNASAGSGTVLYSCVAALSTNSVVCNLPRPINALNGITAVVAGTGATAVLGYTSEGI